MVETEIEKVKLGDLNPEQRRMADTLAHLLLTKEGFESKDLKSNPFASYFVQYEMQRRAFYISQVRNFLQRPANLNNSDLQGISDLKDEELLKSHKLITLDDGKQVEIGQYIGDSTKEAVLEERDRMFHMAMYGVLKKPVHEPLEKSMEDMGKDVVHGSLQSIFHHLTSFDFSGMFSDIGTVITDALSGGITNMIFNLPIVGRYLEAGAVEVAAYGHNALQWAGAKVGWMKNPDYIQVPTWKEAFARVETTRNINDIVDNVKVQGLDKDAPNQDAQNYLRAMMIQATESPDKGPQLDQEHSEVVMLQNRSGLTHLYDFIQAAPVPGAPLASQPAPKPDGAPNPGDKGHEDTPKTQADKPQEAPIPFDPAMQVKMKIARPKDGGWETNLQPSDFNLVDADVDASGNVNKIFLAIPLGHEGAGFYSVDNPGSTTIKVDPKLAAELIPAKSKAIEAEKALDSAYKANKENHSEMTEKAFGEAQKNWLEAQKAEEKVLESVLLAIKPQLNDEHLLAIQVSKLTDKGFVDGDRKPEEVSAMPRSHVPPAPQPPAPPTPPAPHMAHEGEPVVLPVPDAPVPPQPEQPKMPWVNVPILTPLGLFPIPLPITPHMSKVPADDKDTPAK